MKMQIIIPDELVEKIESTASKLGLSQDELFTTALTEFIERDATITQTLDQIYAEQNSELDPLLERLQRDSLPVEQW